MYSRIYDLSQHFSFGGPWSEKRNVRRNASDDVCDDGGDVRAD